MIHLEEIWWCLVLGFMCSAGYNWPVCTKIKFIQQLLM